MRQIQDIIRRIVIIPAMGMACTAFGAESSSAGTASNVETRTFKLTYASAVEVAERLNGQMCRELGPDGKPFRVATAYEEANAVSVTASPETVKACAGIVEEVDVKPKQVYVEARFVA